MQRRRARTARHTQGNVNIWFFFPSNLLVFERWLFLVSKWRVMSAGKHNSLTRSIFGWFAFVTGVQWVQIADSIFCNFDGVWAEMRIAQNFMQDPILFFILICWYYVFVQVNIHFLFQSKFLLCRSVDFVTWKHRGKNSFWNYACLACSARLKSSIWEQFWAKSSLSE